MTRIFGTLVGLILSLSVPAMAAEGGPIEGLWKTEEGDGVVRIEVLPNGTLQGSIVSGSNPDGVDEENPDPALRTRKLVGLAILNGFRPDHAERTRWSGGTIYDPNNGKTYACKMTLKGDRLEIRGYVGLPMFGRTAVWTRAPDDS